MKHETTYNGWSNRETWNTNLWIDNSYETHRAVKNIVEHLNNKGNKTKSEIADAVEYFCRGMWGDENPDSDKLENVNWREIAVSFLPEN